MQNFNWNWMYFIILLRIFYFFYFTYFYEFLLPKYSQTKSMLFKYQNKINNINLTHNYLSFDLVIFLKNSKISTNKN